ncbi:hypothetical protein BS47DRAFT_594527 [Hydnum rufescens UP504]|uniref:Erg28-like protein n=1 Tax=Hydnum rufescens UP504 TaxID=1448309 RepID=A0A9P6E0G8_9AGAM|nr:hypothetical protein BS47DRAFT_594527 [Hydnum rufescens UP504]
MGWFPEGHGWLPLWQLFVSSLAIFNTVQNLFGISLTRRVYSRKPEQVTPLHARAFAAWTLTSAVVRLYCAYNIGHKLLYDLTIWTYVIALVHFASEIFLYKTADISVGALPSCIIASTSLVWMVVQYNFYTR